MDNGYELQVWKSDGFVIEAYGRVRLERDGSGIRSISRGGSLSIKEKESGQEIFVEEEDGEIYYTYYKRGKRLAFEGEGEEWFNSIWKEVAKIIEE